MDNMKICVKVFGLVVGLLLFMQPSESRSQRAPGNSGAVPAPVTEGSVTTDLAEANQKLTEANEKLSEANQALAEANKVLREANDALSKPVDKVKFCSAITPGNWRDSVAVPESWKANDCRKWAASVGGTEVQLGCFFKNDFSWGAVGGTTPQVNCGW